LPLFIQPDYDNFNTVWTLNYNKEISEFVSCSPDETKRIAIEIVSNLSIPNAIYLNGVLGSGKTLFCKSIAEYFGFPDLNSSSFSRVSHFSGSINLVHCDFYRGIPSSMFFEEEVEPLLNKEWIILIEWGDPNMWDFQCKSFELNIEISSNQNRVFRFNEI